MLEHYYKHLARPLFLQWKADNIATHWQAFATNCKKTSWNWYNSSNGNKDLATTENIQLKKPHCNGPLVNEINKKFCHQFSIFKIKYYLLDINNVTNDCVLFDNGICVQIYNFIQYENQRYLIEKEIMCNSSDLYTEPCHSRNFNIHVITNNKCEDISNLKIWSCKHIRAKLCKLQYMHSFVLIPIIHTF